MRETRIAASQQRVWDVVTRAEHIGRWSGDAARRSTCVRAAALRLSWTEHGTALGRVEQVSPIDLFSFHSARPLDTEPVPGNSTLAEFRLIPDGRSRRRRSGATAPRRPRGALRLAP
ncbi:MAG: hypothetical protein QOI36_5471 [Pseudonocardiales bacterium]|nr:hypothetical protein [Pseudonocardiales bacterium]